MIFKLNKGSHVHIDLTFKTRMCCQRNGLEQIMNKTCCPFLLPNSFSLGGKVI